MRRESAMSAALFAAFSVALIVDTSDAASATLADKSTDQPSHSSTRRAEEPVSKDADAACLIDMAALVGKSDDILVLDLRSDSSREPAWIPGAVQISLAEISRSALVQSANRVVLVDESILRASSSSVPSNAVEALQIFAS
jgi:rhodanese-related sulfurtransferase